MLFSDVGSENAARFKDWWKFIQIHHLQKVQHSHSRHQKTTSNLLRINLKGRLRFNNYSWPPKGAMYMYINLQSYMYCKIFRGIPKVLVLCNFLKILMVSDKMIYKAFRTHNILWTKPIREFPYFHKYKPKLYIRFQLCLLKYVWEVIKSFRQQMHTQNFRDKLNLKTSPDHNLLNEILETCFLKCVPNLMQVASNSFPNMFINYCQLRARRVLLLFNVPLRTRRALWQYKVYGDSAQGSDFQWTVVEQH